MNKLQFAIREACGIADNKRHIDPAENRKRTFRTQATEFAYVVDAGRIDEDDRPDRREFTSFFHRVGGCPGNVAHNGDLLVRERVDERTFPGVPTAEKADVKTQAFRGFIAGGDADDRS